MSATLTVNRGTTYPIQVAYKKNGTPFDITGSTILFTVKTTEFSSNLTDTDALIAKAVTAHTDPTNGVSVITLVPSDTRAVVPGKHYYSIKIDEDSDDTKVYELAEGRFDLDGDPTNRIA